MPVLGLSDCQPVLAAVAPIPSSSCSTCRTKGAPFIRIGNKLLVQGWIPCSLPALSRALLPVATPISLPLAKLTTLRRKHDRYWLFQWPLMQCASRSVCGGEWRLWLPCDGCTLSLRQ